MRAARGPEIGHALIPAHSAHSSCQTATWPTWASWRQAPTLTPPRDPPGLPWPRAATAGPALWTSSASRASCFAPGAPVRWSARAQGHRPPPWPEARPGASASSWTVKSEAHTVAGPELFIHVREGPKWHMRVAGGPDLWPPTPHPASLSAPQCCFPFMSGAPSLGGGRRERQGPRDFSSVCKSMKINHL